MRLPSRAIPRVHAPSPESFRRLHELPRLPVVITGALDGRAATRTWSFEHLATHGDVAVTVRVSRRGEAQLFDGNPGAAFEFRELPLRAALAGLSEPNGEVWYVQHCDLRAVPVLHDEVGPLVYASRAARTESKLWVCGAGTKNPLHWDTHHAALAQMAGEKRFVLFPPEDSPKLASFTHRTLWRTTGLDLSAVDRSRFPRVDDASAWSCTVQPGEVLFVPYGWWHYMECDAPTISVTWWWPPSFSAHVRDSLRERLSTWVKRGLRAVRLEEGRSRGPTKASPRSPPSG